VIAGRVLDASAVLDLTRGSTVYAATLLSVATDLAMPMVIPTTALQQTWHALEPEQHVFLELLLGLGVVILDHLDPAAARESGIGSHRSATPEWRWSASQAHSAQCARTRGWPVLTRAPEQLLALDPHLQIEGMPAI
jgi:hypothetical protein